MKEYKIKLVPCSYDRAVTETPEPDTLIGKVKDFFSPVDLPVDPSLPNGGLLTGDAEALMQEMNRAGWEVVSVVPSWDNLTLMITFEREKVSPMDQS